jgi:hypothetical protein
VIPVLIARLSKEIKLYRKYSSILKRVIIENNEFFEFLDKFKFNIAWFNRLYSIQKIPDMIIDQNEDEIYDSVVKALQPVYAMFEKAILVDVLSLRVIRKDIDAYILIFEPINYLVVKRYCIKLVLTIAAYAVIAFTFFHFHTI